MPQPQWQIQPIHELPEWFVRAVGQHTHESSGRYVAQLLWQRGFRDLNQLEGFLDPNRYRCTSAFEFGEEMHRAVKRLQQAWQQAEKVAIWGDFDADGITATAVLWDGLGQFFLQEQQLTYYIPNRLTESHGLSIAGIEQLATWGCTLIVTCDTGSTNPKEIDYANERGIDVIVTDHHTLPPARPPVTAIVNPRNLPPEHPLANLSGVAVAYKLVEALYETLPDVPKRPLETLLDLVAIGLIADLVNLTGDCRYLAQRGIEQLQRQTLQQPSQGNSQTPPTRPGIAKLLDLCKRNGDRPTDISFGLGPRINAISRIHGDARFCVELLTSHDPDRCRQLAEATELANTRRKSLQRDVVQQVKAHLAHLDLSTTNVIVLADPQWSVGVLGLVAGQIAQEYGRPTILLTIEEGEANSHAAHALPGSRLPYPLARGSARSVHAIDLYELVKAQAHLLHSFGGHPLALGLSLPVENIPLFAAAINRQWREHQAELGMATETIVQADLTVSVAELGKDLFRQLKLLEPCGMGNPVPKLLIQNCWFTEVWHRNIQDWKGQKVRYIKTEFQLWDDSTQEGFPGVWWDHYRDEIPTGRCDAIVELDFNAYKKRYEVRLIALRACEPENHISVQATVDWILDWREKASTPDFQLPISDSNPEIIPITRCPASWDEMQTWFRRVMPGQKLALAYSAPEPDSPREVWQRLVGIAKYLSRTGKPATRLQLHEKLGVGDRSLKSGFQALRWLGFEIISSEEGFYVRWKAPPPAESHSDTQHPPQREAIAQFLAIVREEQFQYRYFCSVPLAIVQTAAYWGLRFRNQHR